jgi:hypothetical protein
MQLGGDVGHIPLESATFLNPLRAQITTSSSKQCTYFATQNGTRVFVKGPFATLAIASTTKLVSDFKAYVCPSLSLDNVEVTCVVVDSLKDTPMGTRCSLRGRRAWMQVHRSLLRGDGPLPSKKWGSKKWQPPVDVVDWSRITDSLAHWTYTKDYDDSIFNRDPIAARELVLHLLLSWACGSGADFANRNFLYDRLEHRVWQVDTDVWGRWDWTLPESNGVASQRSGAGAQLWRFIRSQWDVYLRDALTDAYQRAAEGILERGLVFHGSGTGTDDIARIKRRLWRLCKRSTLRTVVCGDDRRTAPPGAAGPPPATMFVGKATSTYRTMLDPWGHSITLRKSDLQKALRRGLPEQALVSFFSAYNQETIFPDSTAAKSARTNIINRLMVIAVEDVSVAAPLMVQRCLEELSPMTRKRGGRRTPRLPALLARIVWALALAQKTRICSHIAHTYARANQEARVNAGLEDIPIFGDVDSSSPEAAMAAIRRGLPPRIYLPIEAARDGAADINKKAFVRYGLALAHYSGGPPGERRNFLRKQIANPLPDPFNASFKLPSVDGTLLRSVTPEGRAMGRRGDHFRTEGAVVENESAMWAEQAMVKIYLETRR